MDLSPPPMTHTDFESDLRLGENLGLSLHRLEWACSLFGGVSLPRPERVTAFQRPSLHPIIHLSQGRVRIGVVALLDLHKPITQTQWLSSLLRGNCIPQKAACQTAVTYGVLVLESQDRDSTNRTRT